MSTRAVAISLASKAHDGQVDKTGQPYIFHPLRVMMALESEADQIVGVLHDVLEDTPATAFDLLSVGFTEDIIAAVVALTRRPHESYEDFILRAAANAIARRVKIADIRDNLRPGAEHLRARYEAALAVLEQPAGRSSLSKEPGDG